MASFKRSVRVQVENTGDTNYPFLHGIIAVDRDNGDHARRPVQIVYKREDTLQKYHRTWNFRDGLARYRLYAKQFSDQNIYKRATTEQTTCIDPPISSTPNSTNKSF